MSPSLYSLKKNSRTYFYSSFLAYIFGLGLTIFVMHTFKHAQVRLLVSADLCTHVRMELHKNFLFVSEQSAKQVDKFRANMHNF